MNETANMFEVVLSLLDAALIILFVRMPGSCHRGVCAWRVTFCDDWTGQGWDVDVLASGMPRDDGDAPRWPTFLDALTPFCCFLLSVAKSS